MLVAGLYFFENKIAPVVVEILPIEVLEEYLSKEDVEAEVAEVGDGDIKVTG
jgi:hypothetical protein